MTVIQGPGSRQARPSGAVEAVATGAAGRVDVVRRVGLAARPVVTVVLTVLVRLPMIAMHRTAPGSAGSAVSVDGRKWPPQRPVRHALARHVAERRVRARVLPARHVVDRRVRARLLPAPHVAHWQLPAPVLARLVPYCR